MTVTLQRCAERTELLGYSVVGVGSAVHSGGASGRAAWHRMKPSMTCIQPYRECCSIFCWHQRQVDVLVIRGGPAMTDGLLNAQESSSPRTASLCSGQGQL